MFLTEIMVFLLLSWIVLNERPSFVAGLAMLLSLFGVVIMVRTGISVGTGWVQCLALISALSFGAVYPTVSGILIVEAPDSIATLTTFIR